MVFVDPYFLAGLVSLVLISDQVTNQKAFLLVLLLFSNLFLCLVLPLEKVALIYGFVLTGYLATVLTVKYGKKLVFPSLLILLAEYLLFHANISVGLVSGVQGVVSVLGFSYIFCRMVHLLVDHAGDTEHSVSISIWHYLTFNLSFLTFLSGPLQRYKPYCSALRERSIPAGRTRQKALGRMLVGYLKLLLIVPLFNRIYLSLIESAQLLSSHQNPFLSGYGAGWILFAAAMMLLLYVYLNFSAYMDLVVGLGRLIGFQIPENFNRPLLAGSLLEWWGRWHITMSEWYRDYIYNTVLMLLCRRSAPKNNVHLTLYAVLGLLATFVVVGLWHAVTLDWVILGLGVGSGISVNRVWYAYLNARLGAKQYSRLRQAKWYRMASTGLTYFFITGLGLGYLVISDQLSITWQPAIHEVFIVLVFGYVGLSLLSEIYRGGLARLDTIGDRPGLGLRLMNSSGVLALWSACTMCLLMLVYLGGMYDIPEFVYAQF
ncbi:MAG: hypothetical protein MI864_01415 [Pseudomonadales bacterium]|nr:hypothetical protein [Pseudomonadales bacterium]